MIKLPTPFFLCFVLLFFSSCINKPDHGRTSFADSNRARFGKDRIFPDLSYQGDGKFSDYGRKAGINRFVLDLGEVDLDKAFHVEHDLIGLPEVEFVCYLRISHPLPTFGAPTDFIAGDLVVELSLDAQDGEQVFVEKAPLNRWIWSGSVGASKSDLYTRKTIFTVEKGKTYNLSLKVLAGKKAAPKAQLLLMGGGWKVGR